MIYTHQLPDGRKYASLLETPIENGLACSSTVANFCSSYGVSKVLEQDDQALILPLHLNGEISSHSRCRVRGGHAEVLKPKRGDAAVPIEWDEWYKCWKGVGVLIRDTTPSEQIAIVQQGVLSWTSRHENDYMHVTWEPLVGDAHDDYWF